jgi:Ca2+-binding RTX toxin-like protein
VATYDVVHINTGYGRNSTTPLSDHDPAVATLDFRFLGETLNGTSGNDFFRVEQGGNDTVSGLAGRDIFFFGGAFTADDQVNGGTGIDTLALQGNYGGGLILGTGTTSNINSVEWISLLSGANTFFGESGSNRYSYNITVLDSNFSDVEGGFVRVNGGNLLAGEDFTFNGAAETDARFVIYAGLGVDTLIGGAQSDIFFFGHDMTFNAGDTAIGGEGMDGMFLRGDYTLDLNDAGYAGSISSIENITLSSFTDERHQRGGDGEFDYDIIWNDDLLATGESLTVNGSLLTAEETMVFDGSRETGGNFRLFGGASNDVLTGGAGNDLISGGLRGDILTGGGGNDIFRYDSVEESNSVGRDSIQDFSAGDLIDLSRIDANTLIEGDQTFDFIGNAAFSNKAGELRFENVSSGGSIWLVQGDVDGDGVSDFELTVITNTPDPITPADFIL